MPNTTVAIIGAGSGGIYLAAELGTLGCRLRLTDRDDNRLAPLRTRGGLDVDPGGFAAIERVTTSLAEAVDGADIIAVCTGGTYQESVATATERPVVRRTFVAPILPLPLSRMSSPVLHRTSKYPNGMPPTR